jgi:hypothetical protein
MTLLSTAVYTVCTEKYTSMTMLSLVAYGGVHRTEHLNDIDANGGIHRTVHFNNNITVLYTSSHTVVCNGKQCIHRTAHFSDNVV